MCERFGENNIEKNYFEKTEQEKNVLYKNDF